MRSPGHASTTASSRGGADGPPTEHYVQFYEDEDGIVEAAAEFVDGGLASGGAGIVVATPKHRESIGARLSARGLDLESLRRDGRYVAVDASQIATSFLVDGTPDPYRFRDVVGRLLDRPPAEARHEVRIFDEIVTHLWTESRREAAVRVERLWNELGRDHRFSVLCAYPLKAFDADADAKPLLDICAEHRHAIPGESWAGLPTEDDRLRRVIELQQKALALGAESSRRRDLEDALRRSERELADLLENTQDGVLDLDPDGTVRSANPAHLRALGYSADEYVGRPISEFLVSGDVFRRVWGGLVRGVPVRGANADLRCRDGSTRRLSIQSSSLRVMQKALQMRWLLREPPRTAWVAR